MTKIEQMICAQKVWRNGRGKTAKSRRDAFLRAMRSRNWQFPKEYCLWYIDSVFGTECKFFGTLRQAKIYANSMRIWSKLQYIVRDAALNIDVYKTQE